MRTLAILMILGLVVGCQDETDGRTVRVGMPLAEAKAILADAGAEETLYQVQPIDEPDTHYILRTGRGLIVGGGRAEDGEMVVTGLTILVFGDPPGKHTTTMKSVDSVAPSGREYQEAERLSAAPSKTPVFRLIPGEGELVLEYDSDKPFTLSMLLDAESRVSSERHLPGQGSIRLFQDKGALWLSENRRSYGRITSRSEPLELIDQPVEAGPMRYLIGRSRDPEADTKVYLTILVE